MKLGNYTPGVVATYNAQTRLCRVSIPGVTDGAEVLPEAMLCYPIGDKSEHTEIRILPGDRVWLDFVNGDPRFPIITGFRPKETDNAIDWRRLHHANIEFTADADITVQASGGVVLIQAGTKVRIEAPLIEVVGQMDVTGDVQITGAVQIAGDVATTGELTNNSVNVGSTHIHAYRDDLGHGDVRDKVTAVPQ